MGTSALSAPKCASASEQDRVSKDISIDRRAFVPLCDFSVAFVLHSMFWMTWSFLLQAFCPFVFLGGERSACQATKTRAPNLEP